MNSLMGFSKDFVQDKFTSDEIKQAIDLGNEKYGVEVSYCPSQIKVYPKELKRRQRRNDRLFRQDSPYQED